VRSNPLTTGSIHFQRALVSDTRAARWTGPDVATQPNVSEVSHTVLQANVRITIWYSSPSARAHSRKGRDVSEHVPQSVSVLSTLCAALMRRVVANGRNARLIAKCAAA
jgi:hypothetical protein